MGDIVQLIVQAGALSAVYACVAVGFSLVFAATRVTQFAAGNIAVFGGVVFAKLHQDIGGVPALIATLLSGALLGAAIYLLIIRLGEFRQATAIALSIGALGVGLALDAVVGLWTGNVPQVADPTLTGAFTIDGARIAHYSLFVVAVAMVLLGLVYLLVFRTMIGKSMLAVAYKPTVAVVSGINTRQVSTIAWSISTMLMATAGALLIPLSVITRDVALPLSVAGFAAAIVGGLGSFNGAWIGAVVIGLAQTLFARYVSSSYIDTLVFLVLFLVLVIRPSGLFGSRDVRLA